MYCSIADIREYDESITGTAYPDQAVSDAIIVAGRIIDKETRQWFEPRTMDMVLTGNGIDDLVLPVPAIEVTLVTLNDDELAGEDYKLALTSEGVRRFLRRKYGVWERGSEVVVSGRFGCVEEDEGVPPEAKRLCMMLAVILLKKEGDQPVFKSESFKDHSYSRDDTGELFWGSSEAGRLLQMLKAPVIPGVV